MSACLVYHVVLTNSNAWYEGLKVMKPDATAHNDGKRTWTGSLPAHNHVSRACSATLHSLRHALRFGLFLRRSLTG